MIAKTIKKLFSIILILGLFLVVIQNVIKIKNHPKKNIKVAKSKALEGLDFWSKQRAYPNRSIPDTKFYKAFESSNKYLRKRSQPIETQDTWQSIGPDNRGGRTIALAVDPNNPNVIYAGSASGGLWRLTMDEQDYEWEYIDTGFPVLGVNSIAIDPTNSDVIYIGTGEVYGYQRSIGGLYIRTTRGSYGIGLLKTSDRGQTWTKSIDWSYNQQRGVLALEINPLNPKVIYAGTSEGVYKSTDSGENWENVFPVLMAVDVAINPVDTSIVFVSCGNLNTTPKAGIYRSSNYGGSGTWQKLTNGLPSSWGGKALLDIHKADPNIIYASIGNGYTSKAGTWLCKSTDQGDNWTIVNRHNYSSYQGWFAHYVRVDPVNPNKLFCAGVDFYSSINGGNNLKIYPRYLMHVDHHCFANHPTDPNIIYFGNDGGVYRTTDGGSTYNQLNDGYITSQFYHGFASSALNSDFALGGLQDNGTIKYSGNNDWDLGIYGGDGAFCGIDALNNNIIYVSYQYLRIQRSIDGGFIWTNISQSFNGSPVFVAPYVLSPAQPWILYAGDSYIYRSENRGNSWIKMNNGKPLSPIYANPILTIAVSPANPDVVYAATVPTTGKRAEVFSSSDGGNAWANITGTLPDRYYIDLKVSPHDDNVVYITLSGFGTSHIYRTEDGGQNWNDIDNGQLPDLPTSAISVDPGIPDHIYIGNDLGVYVSKDYGVSWSEFRDGLPSAVLVMDLSISPSNRKLRAVTHGNGVYERSLLTSTSVNEDLPTSVTTFELFQNYPNPFSTGSGSAFGGNPETTIQFAIPEPSFVTLKIYNSLGQEVRILIANGYPTGLFSVIWDGKDNFGSPVPGGMYFYRLKVGNFETSKVMSVVR